MATLIPTVAARTLEVSPMSGTTKVIIAVMLAFLVLTMVQDHLMVEGVKKLEIEAPDMTVYWTAMRSGLSEEGAKAFSREFAGERPNYYSAARFADKNSCWRTAEEEKRMDPHLLAKLRDGSS